MPNKSLSKRGPVTSLPAFIEPMLSKASPAFDSDRHLFEIKWDGTRALAFVHVDGRRLLNRRKADITSRYPELFEALASIPPGTILDGEVVVLREGKPDFNALQSREQARTPRKIKHLVKELPATYMVFDQLYADHQSLLKLPLTERREQLNRTIEAADHPRLIMSRGVTGKGIKYFDECCKEGLEGIVAKRLDSRYLPGKRSDSWLKIKRTETLGCVIIGFVPEGKDDFAALVIATPIDDELRSVGRVGTGFDAALRKRLNKFLWSHRCEHPVVPSKEKAIWVEPLLYCTVRCMERTRSGQLRAPAFGELLNENCANIIDR